MSVKKHNMIHLNIISIKYWFSEPSPYSLGPKTDWKNVKNWRNKNNIATQFFRMN